MNLDRQLREQLDTISRSGRGDHPIHTDITDLLTGRGVEVDLADRLAHDLTNTGWDQVAYWSAVGHTTNAHHLALDACVVAVAFAQMARRRHVGQVA